LSLGSGMDFSLLMRGQLSQGNLDAFQKMSVGGSNGVRAFAPTESNGDDAQLFRVEVGKSFAFFGADHRLSAFYDRCRVSINHSPVIGAGNDVSLGGTGLQWQFNTSGGLASRLYYAFPSGDSSRARSYVDGASARMGWELSCTF